MTINEVDAAEAAAFAGVKAVLFDLDGTLANTAPELSAALNAAFAELRLPPLQQMFITTLIGGGVENLIRRAADAQPAINHVTPLGEPDLRSLRERFQSHYQHLCGQHGKLYPGALGCLRLLASAGIRLGCVTNKARRFVDPLLDRSGLRPLFGVVVCGDTLQQMKPSAAPLLHACTFLGVSPQQTLLVGDSLTDLRSARAAGCRMIGVTYGYNEGHSMVDVGCDAVVNSLTEVAVRIARCRRTRGSSGP